MSILSYLIFIAIIYFLYVANDINLRRRDLVQARIVWFAAARKTDAAIPNDLSQFATLTQEHPTPELLAARDCYQKTWDNLVRCCQRHSIIAAILHVDCQKEQIR